MNERDTRDDDEDADECHNVFKWSVMVFILNKMMNHNV